MPRFRLFSSGAPHPELAHIKFPIDVDGFYNRTGQVCVRFGTNIFIPELGECEEVLTTSSTAV